MGEAKRRRALGLGRRAGRLSNGPVIEVTADNIHAHGIPDASLSVHDVAVLLGGGELVALTAELEEELRSSGKLPTFVIDDACKARALYCPIRNSFFYHPR